MAYDSNHAWNAVKVYLPREGKEAWALVDPTWASGHTEGSKYVAKWNEGHYLVPPALFAQRHFPDDPTWTLLPVPQRPTWRAFITAAHALDLQLAIEHGIVPVSHKRACIQGPPDGRLQIVLRAKRGASFMFKVDGQKESESEAKVVGPGGGSGGDAGGAAGAASSDLYALDVQLPRNGGSPGRVHTIDVFVCTSTDVRVEKTAIGTTTWTSRQFGGVMTYYAVAA
jgi:hypothetical protein